MAEYATRLTNGQDTAARMRRSDLMLLAPNGNGLARAGLRPDGGGAVSINGGTMGVTVQPFTAWVSSASAAQGGYPVVLDAAKVLAINPGHATLVRVDTVVAQVRDTTYDGSGFTDLRVLIVEGTPGAGAPALPATSIPLRNINVPAGASAGTGGLVSGNLGTDRRTYISSVGAPQAVASQAARDALPGIGSGMVVYREDTDVLEVYNGSTWDVWQPKADTGWVDVANTLGGGTVKYRRRENMVTIDVVATAATNSATTYTIVAAGGIPAALRPARNKRGACDFSGFPGTLLVLPTGAVQVAHNSGAARATIEGTATYPLEA